MEKKNIGQPSKLPTFLVEMKGLLEDPRTVILTDKELLVAVNQRLPKNLRVSLSCFEFWKTPNLNSKSPENIEQLDDDMVEDFRQTLAYARVHQKMNLTGNMLDEKNKNQWGASWLLERKFKDLQVNKGGGNIQIGTGNITLKIEGGDSNVIDMIDVDYEVVDEQPKRLITKKDNDM
ncbi:hypothetical protein AAU57_08800 [Nonlabens sp. YIK11]|uniref:hypothetical protein n=1 Tax=Nonlabens sp. YIK11 TaxID=1453349 RepID=UPI0006DCD509|nr:hypothetical protein [Nonlabens sp. YIK11]KQC33401.1 hypothetical protein AAU57_08800 [Nonlabens sp. YIK11]